MTRWRLDLSLDAPSVSHLLTIISFHLFLGEICEFYHCVLESKSFLEKMTVLEHTVPFFLPIRETENDLLSSNAMVKSVICDVVMDYVYLNIFLSLVSIGLHSEIHRSCWRSIASIRG